MLEALVMATAPVWLPLLSIVSAVAVVMAIEWRDHRRRVRERLRGRKAVHLGGTK